MALKSPTHETCSCVSPDAFKDLSSKKRKGVHVTCTHTELSVSIRINFTYFLRIRLRSHDKVISYS